MVKWNDHTNNIMKPKSGNSNSNSDRTGIARLQLPKNTKMESSICIMLTSYRTINLWTYGPSAG